MTKQTIESINAANPDFRVSFQVVNGKRAYRVDHLPSEKGSACTLRTLDTVSSLIASFASTSNSRSYWRSECFTK